jgi:uncharacterized protein
VVRLGGMPAAGFYAIESHTIRFGRDGEWYSDGERIANRRIADLFSRCVRRNSQGGFMLQMGDERAPLEVEDTPFVVRQIEGDRERGFTLILNDGTQEALDPTGLRSGHDNALYCRVKSGEYEARLLRPAYYALAQSVKVGTDGRFVLAVGGRDYPIDAR